MICALTCQYSAVHIVTHNAISKQQTYPKHITLYHNQNNWVP